MKFLFAPIVPFVGHPERVAVVAAAFFLVTLLMWFRRKQIAWPVIGAGLAWALFAIWEGYCKAQGYNIRVDLFLIYPVLLSLTLWGVAEAVIPGISTQPVEKRFSLRTMMIAITTVALVMGIIAWLAR